MRIYTSGAIDRCPDKGQQWRAYITPRLEALGYTVVNPAVATGIVPGDFDRTSKIMRKVVARDFALLDKCQICLTYLDLDVFACGTIDETCRAIDRAYIVVKQGKHRCPYWLLGKIDHRRVFGDWDLLLEALPLASAA